MADKWIIKQWDGAEKTTEYILPGGMSESEISTIMQRLVCMHLNGEEIVNSSLRSNAKNKKLLLDRIGESKPITYGDHPYYTAEIQKHI